MPAELQKNDIVELGIESLGYKGEGVARVGRIPVFISGALPGERVRAVIILVKKDYCVGKLTDILTPSKDRVTPPCPVFGKCGGCDLQHLGYNAQLAFKRDYVRDTLRKIAGLDANVNETVPSDKAYGCRNKMSLPVRSAGGRTRVGFYAHNSHRIVEIDKCLLQSDKVNSIIPLFKKWLESQSAYDEETRRGNVKHLSVRECGGHITVTVVCVKHTDLSPFDALLKQSLTDYALYLNINKQDNNVIFGDKTVLAGGAERAADVYGLTAWVHPMSFMQVNDYIAGKLYAAACGRLQCARAKKVLDAYSGGGMLTAMLASAADSVKGVEIVPEAVQAARQLAADNGIKNASFILGDCRDAVPVLAAGCDLIVLDPPRSGCDEKVLSAVNSSDAETVIYISCNPSTLARDLTRLNNYAAEEITPYDMFPETKHVECLCCLQRVL